MKYIYLLLIIIITILIINNLSNISNKFSNNVINRSTFINEIDKNKLSLEIGALHSPIIDPNVYNNVYILDVFDTDTLRKNYENDEGVDINKIVNVDYVWSGQKYNELITDKKFDQVLSSHNIEHQPDLIKYLNNISSVLIPGGLVYFIIPDKRYCFDYFKKESDIIDILSANIRQDIKPSISNLLEWRIKHTHNNAESHWNNDHGIDKTYDSTHLIPIYNELKKIYNNNNYDYIDTHVWKFSPESFAKNINLLYSMEILDLKLIFYSDTKQNTQEFYAILQKNISNKLDKFDSSELLNKLNEYNFKYIDENNNSINHLVAETTEQLLAIKYIKPDDVVLELGARYGTVSCIVNKMLNNKNNQVSVEPDKNVWNALDLNLTNNKCNANVVKGFISKQLLSLNENGYSGMQQIDHNTTIPNYTLDQIKEKYNISNFTVLIVDCEGCMESFLNENPEILSTLRLITFEEDQPHVCNYDNIKKILTQNNFYEVENTFDVVNRPVWIKRI